MIQINNELRDRAYKCACDHGFHDKEYSNAHWLMLIITEISEAIEADRNGKIITKDDIISYNNLQSERFHKCAYEEYIKGCIGEELSDVIIRCFDFAGLRGISITGIGKKIIEFCKEDDIKTNTEYMYNVISLLYLERLSVGNRIRCVIMTILTFAKWLDIDILWHIEQKIKYNELRPRLNGKKY